MALERRLEGRDQLLKLVKRQAREMQERHRTGLQLGEPYTCHGSCLPSLYGDERGTSYQKESGINSVVDPTDGREQFAIRYPVPEEPLARLQARPPHSIDFVLFDHSVGVVGGLADVAPDAEE